MCLFVLWFMLYFGWTLMRDFEFVGCKVRWVLVSPFCVVVWIDCLGLQAF